MARSRVVAVVVCAAFAAAAASWAVWLRSRPLPPISRAAAVRMAVPDGSFPPRLHLPAGGPTAADEGDAAPRSVAGLDADRPRRTGGSPAVPPSPVVRSAPTVRAARPPRSAAAKPVAPRTAATGPSLPDTSPPPDRSAETRSPAQAQAGTQVSSAGSTGAGTGSAAPDSAPIGVPVAENPEPGSAPEAAAPAVPPVSARPPVVLPPKVIATPGTRYPGDAFRLTVRRQDLGAAAVIEGSEGTVVIRALIRSTGEVHSVEVMGSSGSEALDRAAAEAVRGWRFAPATRDGTPIDAYVTLRIRYVVR